MCEEAGEVTHNPTKSPQFHSSTIRDADRAKQ